MDTDSGSHQETGSSSQVSGVDPAGVTRGAWMGSNVSQYEIDWLYRSRRIPEGVSCRLPGDEIEPVLEPGEHVVFLAHFERGFGLPVSEFFRKFLDFYELQPHHLPGKREGRELGHLLPYAQKWNAADMSPATRGMGKDRLPAPDPAGDRSAEEHFMRLRRAVKELDSAWYDATNNLMLSRKLLSRLPRLSLPHRGEGPAYQQHQEELKRPASHLQGAQGSAYPAWP
ncbi:hypothetical protein QYE76_056008 [Lolium multiflorum]|uniref:Transposase (putative) gypsy type domain-containing protein n=1 Tax=Lolium multiflorum TaxID=4521 RepID=A0AAD8T1C5_LOLMU|nr:hypothetical protein QYE76_056008 [Lolium multiflorum]